LLSPFEGERIRLRAREPEDLDCMHAWINDWEVIKYLGGRYPRSRKFEQDWLANGDIEFGKAQFMVETLDDRRSIAWVGLHGATPEDRAANLGIAIGDHDFLDGGYGTDIMRTACRFGFEMMNLNRIGLTVYDWNPRAIRVYEKVGFRHEGVLRDGVYKDGRWNNLVVMGVLRGELK
jgi:RimJ/RimL family protein N-acetyltransferase